MRSASMGINIAILAIVVALAAWNAVSLLLNIPDDANKLASFMAGVDAMLEGSMGWLLALLSASGIAYIHFEDRIKGMMLPGKTAVPVVSMRQLLDDTEGQRLERLLQEYEGLSDPSNRWLHVRALAKRWAGSDIHAFWHPKLRRLKDDIANDVLPAAPDDDGGLGQWAKIDMVNMRPYWANMGLVSRERPSHGTR